MSTNTVFSHGRLFQVLFCDLPFTIFALICWFPGTQKPILEIQVTSKIRLYVKAATEPDSAESTEIADRARAESTEYYGKLGFPDTGI